MREHSEGPGRALRCVELFSSAWRGAAGPATSPTHYNSRFCDEKEIPLPGDVPVAATFQQHWNYGVKALVARQKLDGVALNRDARHREGCCRNGMTPAPPRSARARGLVCNGLALLHTCGVEEEIQIDISVFKSY